MSHVRSAVLCFVSLCVLAPSMHAGLVTFATSGVTQNGSVLTGDIVIDTATGAVSSLSLTMTGAFSFTVNTFDAGFSGPNSGSYSISGYNGTTFPFVSLDISATTLVGYAGGSLCTVGSTCNGASSSAGASATTSGFVSGSLTETPEPASLALVGGAMLGLIALKRRRHTR